jgi:hypothetical protein
MHGHFEIIVDLLINAPINCFFKMAVYNNSMTSWLMFVSADLLCSSFGYLMKLVGRVPVFILGATINIVVIIVMFTWQPTLNSQPGASKFTTTISIINIIRSSCHHHPFANRLILSPPSSTSECHRHSSSSTSCDCHYHHGRVLFSSSSAYLIRS